MPIIDFEKQAFLWFRKKQFLILCAVISSLLFFPASFEGSIHAAFIFSMLIFGLFSWLTTKASSMHHVAHPLFWPFTVFILAGIISTLFSSNLAASINLVSRDIAHVMLFILAATGITKIQSILSGLKIIVIVGLVLACYGIFQYVIGFQLSMQDIIQADQQASPLVDQILGLLASKRVFSLFAYPNLFGGFLALLLPLVLIMIHSEQRSTRWYWIIGLVIIFVALFCTGSFGSWLAAMTASLLFYSLYPSQSKEKKIAQAIIFIIAIIGWSILISGRSWDALWQSLHGRLSSWHATLIMIKQHWLLGVGPGRFGQAFSQLQLDHQHYSRFAHQLLLQQFAEKGILGLISMLWLLGKSFHYLIKLKLKFISDTQSIIMIGLIASVLAGLGHAMIDIDADYIKTSMLIWFLSGLLFAMAISVAKLSPIQTSMANWYIKPGLIYFYSIIALFICLLWQGGKSLIIEGSVSVIISILIGLVLLQIKFHPIDIFTYWKQIPFRRAWSLLVFWVLICIAYSHHPWLGLSTLWLLLSGLVLAVIIYFYSKLDQTLFLTIALASTLLAGVTIIDWILQAGGRANGGWPTSNLTAAFLAAGLMINLTQALIGQGNHWAVKRGWLSSALLMMALLCTGSFSGLINLLIGLLIILTWAYKKQMVRKATLFIIGIGCLIIVFLLPLQTGQRLKQLNQYHGQAYERLGLIKSTIRMIQDHPITGIGPGHFNQSFESYKFPNIRGLAKYGRQANFVHNEPLQLVVTIGLPGLLIMGWIFIGIIRRFSRFWKQPKYYSYQLDTIMGWAIIWGGLAQGLFDFNWHLPILFIMYMMLLGKLLRVKKGNDREQTFLMDSKYALPLRASSGQLLIILLIVSFVIVANRPVLSRYFVQLGEAHYYKKHLKVSAVAFEQALSLTPLSAKAYDRLGLVQQDLFSVYQAEQWFVLSEWSFLKSIQLNPGDGFTYRHLARLYHQRALQDKDQPRLPWFNKAEQRYQQAITNAPKSALLYFEYANVLRDAGKLNHAKKMWEKALTIEPNYAAAASNLGVVCELLNLDQEAEKAYRQALSIKQFQNEIETKLEIELFSLNWSIVHYNLGALLERQDKVAEAKQEYLKALTLEPQNKLAMERLIKLEKNH